MSDTLKQVREIKLTVEDINYLNTWLNYKLYQLKIEYGATKHHITSKQRETLLKDIERVRLIMLKFIHTPEELNTLMQLKNTT